MSPCPAPERRGLASGGSKHSGAGVGRWSFGGGSFDEHGDNPRQAIAMVSYTDDRPNLFAHEVFHLLGARHDPVELANCDEGFGYHNLPSKPSCGHFPDVAAGDRIGTIMTYATGCPVSIIGRRLCSQEPVLSQPATWWTEEEWGVGTEEVIGNVEKNNNYCVVSSFWDYVSRYSDADTSTVAVPSQTCDDCDSVPTPVCD